MMDTKELTYPSERQPPRLDDWDSWLDNAIAEAELRGDFDNLPGHGKPLHFDADPLTGEIDVGHGLLKSAGMAPAWIEFDQEIRAGLDALATLRDETVIRLASLATWADAPERRPVPTQQRSWWRSLLGRPHPPAPTAADVPNARRFADERAKARAAYLERAREIDGKIADFNASLPAALWHLERARLPPERAARDFDEVCPPPGNASAVRNQP